MKVWKDKSGKWIDAKEFSSRWKQGIEGVTQLQQQKSIIFFNWIIILGITCGIIVSLFALDKMWWVAIILVAALGNQSIAQIGASQRYKALKQMDASLKAMEDITEIKEEVK